MLDHSSLLSANMLGFFPERKRSHSPSDSRQIKQIYSLALKNSPFAKKAAAGLTCQFSGAALWQLKWNENYFWESAGPLDFSSSSSFYFYFFLLLDEDSQSDATLPLDSGDLWSDSAKKRRSMAAWRRASLDQPLYALVSGRCLLLVVCSRWQSGV